MAAALLLVLLGKDTEVGKNTANTAEKKTIATILATTKGKNPNFKFS